MYWRLLFIMQLWEPSNKQGGLYCYIKEQGHGYDPWAMYWGLLLIMQLQVPSNKQGGLYYYMLEDIVGTAYSCEPKRAYKVTSCNCRFPLITREDCITICKSKDMVMTPGQCTGDCCSSCNCGNPVISREDCTSLCKNKGTVMTPEQCTGDCCSSCNCMVSP